MNFLRKEMERIWKEFPCLSPSSRLHWKALPYHFGTSFWLGTLYVLNWRPARMKKAWKSRWRRLGW